jgi:putative ATP-dependent endonuclease of OLD family
MRLHSLTIDGFKRIKKAKIFFGDATFLIGMNNAGKSSILQAIDSLLSAKKTLDSKLYFSEADPLTGETKPSVDTVVLEAEFRNVPNEAKDWRGFKGRIFSLAAPTAEDTGLAFTYKKTYKFGSDVLIEIKSHELSRNAQFLNCKTGQDFVNCGLDKKLAAEIFTDLETVITGAKANQEKLMLLNDIWEESDIEKWMPNPGGIPAVVLSMLPRFLLIPAEACGSEIDGTGSVLGKTMGELFEDLRGMSANYAEAQKHLNALAKEFDPLDVGSDFGKMMSELNTVLGSVFPDSQLHAKAVLSDPTTVIKPSFNVELSSNVRTSVAHQGSGMVRAAAFGILRFRQKWLSSREDKHKRTLIVCFEEPETFLHPSAANQMRNAIYELSSGQAQIVATTHSPFIIDLSRKPRQILNCVRQEKEGVKVCPFNVTESYEKLDANDKKHIKMLARMDDYVARIFFTKNVVIIEGDTEEIVIKESLRRLPKEKYMRILADFEIVKARGKASIISLVKYLVAMDISPIVVHDRDAGVAGAVVMNGPIALAMEGRGLVVQMHENIEDVLGYVAPKTEKPYQAYKQTLTWGNEWNDIPAQWRLQMEQIFGDYVK